MGASNGSNKLEVTLPSDLEIVMRRAFDAPAHLVYETMTKPEYVRRWWCCMEGCTMTVCEIDLRVGGVWRFAMTVPDGTEVGFHGEYREIVPPERGPGARARIVQTEIFEPFPQEVTVCTMTLEERGGKTYYECHVQHLTKEGRDMHIASGMEGGASLALDRLDEVARSLAAPMPATSPARGHATVS